MTAASVVAIAAWNSADVASAPGSVRNSAMNGSRAPEVRIEAVSDLRRLRCRVQPAARGQLTGGSGRERCRDRGEGEHDEEDD